MKNGDWVYNPQNLFGPAQVVEEGPIVTEVRAGATPGTSKDHAIRTSDLSLYVPRPGDPVWLPLAGKTWAQCIFEMSHGGKWYVKSSFFSHSIQVDPEILWLKSRGQTVETMDMVRELMTSEKGDLTPRMRFREWLAEQAANSAGYSALLTAPLRPVPHQINAMARVLSDPVRRYLLADEVGLGKTIEAGLIIKQSLADDPKATICVMVPTALQPQWLDELRRKLRLDSALKSGQIVIRTHEAIEQIPECQLLVIDEAHRLCEEGWHAFSSFASLCSIAHRTPSLLLLSATPLRGKAETFLRMLHLIDPETFPLNDLETFRIRLNNRASQAQTLKLLKFETHPDIVRELVADLRPSLPAGHGLDDLIDRAASIEDHDERRRIIDELALVIRQRFRVGSRVIRTARTSVDPSEFPVPGRRLVELELDHDEGSVVDALVEDWLDRARTVSNEIPEQLGDFLTAALGGMRTLRAFAQDRLEVLREDALEIFPAEQLWLEKVLGVPEKSNDFIELVLATIRDRFARQGPPEVVAATSPRVAQQVFEDLLSRLGPNLVAAYLDDHEDSDRLQILYALEGQTPPRVVVIDRSAEEGCNLQRARGIVNLDLLWDVNRFEQRLGRLDRYAPGVASPIEVIVPTNSSSRLRTDFIAFLKIVGVLDRSVSTLQRSLSVVMGQLERSVFDNGLDGLKVDADEVANALDTDLMDVELLEYFEAQDLVEEFPANLVVALLEMDEDWGKGQRALNGMTSRDGGYDIKRTPVREDGAGFHYAISEHTRIAEPWRSKLKTVSPKFATISRPLALKNDHYVLLRSGHPFIDLLEHALRRDERGRLEIRRIVDPFATTTEVAFQTELSVSWDLDAGGSSVPKSVLSGIKRRLDSRLPRRFLEVTFDQLGNPFDQIEQWFDGRQNERIGAKKLIEMLNYCPDWGQLVGVLEEAIDEHVRQPLDTEISNALEALRQDGRRRLEQLHSGEVAARDLEHELQTILERSVTNVTVCVESIRVLIKSAIELGTSK